MKVKMLSDAPGSPDGVTVFQYNEGEVYDTTDDLAAVFVEHGLAELTEDAIAAVDPEPEPEGADAEDLTGKKKDGPAEDKKAAGPSEDK